jgi:hypothetical protein
MVDRRHAGGEKFAAAGLPSACSVRESSEIAPTTIGRDGHRSKIGNGSNVAQVGDERTAAAFKSRAAASFAYSFQIDASIRLGSLAPRTYNPGPKL